MLIRLYGVTRIRELFIQEKLEEKRGRLMKHCMMKKLIFVWMTALLLCGAGALAETEALTTKEDEHEVTFTAEQTSRNEYGESVYDIRVTMDGQQTQVISFTTEGTNESEQEMYLTDVNMDGYPDLALLRSMGASDGFASHYVYDPAAGEFIYHPELNDLSWYRCAFYPDGRYVLNTLHSGAAYSITDEERCNINLFLSNFTEQGMTRYDEDSSTDEDLVRFSVWHLWFNQHDRWESGAWGNNNQRLSDKGIADIAQKYFGRRPLMLDLPEMDYDGSYYYFEATGGNMGIGFASLSKVEALGGGLYRVYFGVYGEGEAWSAADCELLPEQAADLYDQTPPRQGCAVIRSLGLDSQNGMTLSKLLIE